MRVFHETQRFDQWWVWALLLLSVLTFFIPAIQSWYTTGEPMEWTMTTEFWIGILIVLLVVLFVRSMALDTKIDEQGVHYRFRPFQARSRTLPWPSLKTCYIRTYSPIREYGGWGYRTSLAGKGKAYNVKGRTGIQMETLEGKKLLVGTQKGTEAAEVIRRYFQNKPNYEGI